MDARKNVVVNNPITRFHHFKQLISLPAISEVVFLFQICRSTELRQKKDDTAAGPPPEAAAVGKSAGQ